MGDSVQFLFELDAKAPGMDKLLAGLDHTNTSLKQGHGALKKEADEVHGLMGAFDKLVHNGLEPFLKKAEQVAEFEFIREGAEKLLEFPGELAEKLAELGEELVRTAAKAESLNFSMKVNFGQEGGEEVSKWSEKLAKQTPFTGPQWKEWANDLGHAGVALKDMDRYAFAALDASARASNKVAAMEQAMQVFKKMNETGKVRGNMLGEIVPAEHFRFLPGFEKLSKQQIFQKLNETDLKPADVFRAMTDGKPIGQTGAGMKDLLDTKLKNVKGLPDEYFEAAAEGPAMEPFKAKLDELYKSFDPSSEKGQAILKSFNDMLMTVVEGIQQIDFKQVAADFREFVSALKQIIPVGTWLVGSTAKTLGDTAHVVGAVAKPALPLIGYLDERHSRAQAAEDALRRQGALPSQSGAGKILDNIPGYSALTDRVLNPDWWRLMYGNATKGAVKGLQDGTPSVEDAGADVGAAAVKGAASPDGMHTQSPSKKTRQLGRWFTEGFSIGVNETKGDIADAMQSAFALTPRRAAGGDLGGGARVSFGDVQVHLQHGGREEGEAAGAGFMASVEARIISLLQRKTTEEGGS